MGPKFTDLLNDELSIFEEGRAVREIFRHEEELEKEQERREEEEKRAEFQRQKAKRDKGPFFLSSFFSLGQTTTRPERREDSWRRSSGRRSRTSIS